MDERKWAAACHLASFLGLIPFGHLLGPLTVWLMKRKESKLVDENGKQSLNFQLSTTLYMLAAQIFVLVGLPPGVLLLFAFIVMGLVIAAAVKILRGESFRYPLALRIIR